jgi:hypothetical protein
MSTSELQIRHMELALDYYGTRAQRMASQGAPVKVVRDELETLAVLNGHLGLRAGLPPESIRERLFALAETVPVPGARAAVWRGFRRAERRWRQNVEPQTP